MHLYLAFAMMTITKETLEIFMWNFAWRWSINMVTSSVWDIAYKPKISNMVTVRNF